VAQYSRPTPDNGRVITDDDYEQLTSGYALDSINGSTADSFPVYADSTGRQVKIRSGKKAIVRGYLWGSDISADEVVPTTTNTSGNPRIDRLVLRLDRTTRNVRTALLTGTPGVTPAPPALTQNTGTSGFWDFPLARWQVATGYTTIAASDVVAEGWYTANQSRLACLSTGIRPAGAAVEPGMELFETDSGFAYRYNGAKWLRNDDEQLVTTDQSWQNNTTYAGITPGNLTPSRSLGFGFPVDAASRYTFELRLHMIGPSGAGLGLRTKMPSFARIDINLSGWTPAALIWTGDFQNVTDSPHAWGVFGDQGSTPPNTFLRAGGTILTGAAGGNLQFEFAQGTANAAASAVLVGSSLRHRQIS
jgi:hypothetical protein